MKEGRDSKQKEKLNMQQELDRPGKLMVSGIPKVKDYKDSDLEKHFSPYGRVTEVYIVRDKRTNIPRGFAFVTYENPKDSEVAIKAMEGKDLGGECKVHCEQARIGLKMSMSKNPPGQGGGRGSGGGRGNGRGRGNEPYSDRGIPRGGGMMDRGRGMMDRGRGMMDRGRGMMDRGRGIMGRGLMDRGRGLMDRGRGLMNMGARGMPPMGMGMFDEESFDYQEEEFYDEFYDPEPPNMRFPPPGGPGGLSMRGHMPGRGGPQGLASLAARKALLPDPLVRGSRIATYPASLLGPPPEDFYGDDANEADYYGDNGNPYAESRGEAYPEGVDYPSEEYYEQEWQAQPRGRGALASRGRGLIPRGVPEARTPRQQMDDYGYEAEGAPPQRSRATVTRRGAQAYADELFDEEDIRLSGVAPDPYSVGRGRSSASAGPSASSARLGRVNPAGRAGAASARRAGPLLEADPYADEDPSMYDRVPTAALKGGAARAAADYEDDPYADPYGRRVASGGSRQTAAGRSRAAMMSSDAMYPGERSQPKPLMGADGMTARKGPGASRVDDDDDYQGRGLLGAKPRAAYSEGRRQVGMRGDPDFDMIEEMYGRMAAEADEYAAFQSSSRGPGDMFSDPYSRKRPMDPFEDPELGGHAMSAMRRDYEAAVSASKRDRVDRSGDRGGYDPYGRQEAMFRGL